MYRQLLVAVDGTDRGTAAARHAVALAKSVGASLEALHVVDVQPVYSRYGLAALPSEDELEHKHEQGKELLEDIRSLADDNSVECETAIRRGTPHIRIVDYAEATDVDAIVIGEPEPHRLQNLLGISTTGRVIRNTECTVIVAR